MTCESAEFVAWSAFVMAPIIWCLQGPSVSTDQFLFRSSLIAASAVVAAGMRVMALIRPLPNASGNLDAPEKTERT